MKKDVWRKYLLLNVKPGRISVKIFGDRSFDGRYFGIILRLTYDFESWAVDVSLGGPDPLMAETRRPRPPHGF